MYKITPLKQYWREARFHLVSTQKAPLLSSQYRFTQEKQCWGYVTFWCGFGSMDPYFLLIAVSGSNSKFDPFFSDFKDPKNFFSQHLPAGTLSSVIKIYFWLKFCVKKLSWKLYFSLLNTIMRKGKDSDPYFWLMNPDPWGPETCWSPTLRRRILNSLSTDFHLEGSWARTSLLDSTLKALALGLSVRSTWKAAWPGPRCDAYSRPGARSPSLRPWVDTAVLSPSPGTERFVSRGLWLICHLPFLQFGNDQNLHGTSKAN